jgi:hypothetical protein
MGQSANIAHFVAFFISFQNIVTLKLHFGANRGYWWFKKLLFTSNSLTEFRQKSAVFAPKMNPQNAQTVFESSVMDIYDIHYKKTRYNVQYYL